MIIAIILGIICLIAGYFLRNSIHEEFLDDKKFKIPVFALALVFFVIGLFYAYSYSLFGLFMYWGGNLL